MQTRDVIIIGAGPSGLFCALHLPEGLKVLILEKSEHSATKLLMSAKGRGNLTNVSLDPALDYVSSDTSFVQQAFRQYGVQDFLQFLRENAVAFQEEENSRILLQSGKVSQFREVLVQKLAEKGVEISYGQELQSVVCQEEGGFKIQTSSASFSAKKVILATGSKSVPKLGSSDIALQVARDFGLKYTDFYPALVGFETEKDLSSLSGSSVMGKGELYVRGKLIYEQS
jgi:predicted Rossmann fold flavoprotein